MDNLKSLIVNYSNSTKTKVTPKEMKLLWEYIMSQALEYYMTEYVNIDEAYLSTILEDIRQNRL